MCPMVHSDGMDSGMGYMEWDMGEGLYSPHVSHGTFRRDGQWDGVYGVGHGDGLYSPHVSHGTFRRDGQWDGVYGMRHAWGMVWTVPMSLCPMVVFMLKWDMHTTLVGSGCQQPVLDSFNQHSPSLTNQYFLKLYNVHDIRTCPPLIWKNGHHSEFLGRTLAMGDAWVWKVPMCSMAG